MIGSRWTTDKQGFDGTTFVFIFHGTEHLLLKYVSCKQRKYSANRFQYLDTNFEMIHCWSYKELCKTLDINSSSFIRRLKLFRDFM